MNEDKTTVEQLHSIIVSSNLQLGTLPIYLSCETKQFRYIVDKLSIYFTNLKPSSIERSKLFYSSNNTLINAQLLSSSKTDSPKEKATIDDICKYLQ